MDVDAVTTSEGSERASWRERGGLSDTKRKKQRSEGRCFLRRACPKRDESRGGKERGREEKARAVTIEGNQQKEQGKENDDAPGPPAYNPDSLINHIKTPPSVVAGVDKEDPVLGASRTQERRRDRCGGR